MLDEFASRFFRWLWKNLRALPVGIRSLLLLYFSDFRVVEFTAAVGTAFAAGNELCSRLGITGVTAQKIAGFCALVGAVCFIRNPKTKQWQGDAIEGSVSGSPDGETGDEPTDAIGTAVDRVTDEVQETVTASVRDELSRATPKIVSQILKPRKEQ